jgi:hypothetical protein
VSVPAAPGLARAFIGAPPAPAHAVTAAKILPVAIVAAIAAALAIVRARGSCPAILASAILTALVIPTTPIVISPSVVRHDCLLVLK